jgi:hypothetical protein
MAAMLDENALQIQELLMIFFCERSSNMAAVTSSVNEEYRKCSRGSDLQWLIYVRHVLGGGPF